jgi:hypothetical protein
MPNEGKARTRSAVREPEPISLVISYTAQAFQPAVCHLRSTAAHLHSSACAQFLCALPKLPR